MHLEHTNFSKSHSNYTTRIHIKVHSPDEAMLSSKLAYGGCANFLLLARACALAAAMAPTLPNVSFFVAEDTRIVRMVRVIAR